MNPNKFFAVVTQYMGAGKYKLTPFLQKSETYAGGTSYVDSFQNVDADIASATIDAYNLAELTLEGDTFPSTVKFVPEQKAKIGQVVLFKTHALYGWYFDSAGGAISEKELWIKVTDFTDLPDRRKLYEWEAVIPDVDNPGEYVPLLATPVGGGPAVPLTWESEYVTGVTYGEAINGAENPITLSMRRPLRVDSVVRAYLFVKPPVDPETEPTLQMVISATNYERQFFATITGYAAGYYSWQEIFADGTAVSAPSDPWSGDRAVNSYYGLALLPGDPKIVPNGKIVLMELLPSDADTELVGFTLNMDIGEGADIRGDQMLVAPSTMPAPYPPTDGAAVLIGTVGAWIEVWELDDPDNPGSRIKRIYHKPPTVAADDAEDMWFDTVDVETVDGDISVVTGSGSAEFQNAKIKNDLMGHYFSTEPAEKTFTLHGGDHIALKETLPGEDMHIEHTVPGPPVTQEEIGVEDDAGGVQISIGPIGFDDLGHKTATPEGNGSFRIQGDSWINVAIGLGPLATTAMVTHKDPDTLSASVHQIITGVSIDSLSTTLRITHNTVTKDGKGHIIEITAGTDITVDLTPAMDAWWDAKTKVPCPGTP